MNAGERVYERLARANPVTDITQYQPARSEAIAFTDRIEGRAMGTETIVQQPAISQVSVSRIAIAVASFIVIVALGAVALVMTSGDTQNPVAALPTTVIPQLVEEPIAESEQLARVRQAVNSGDAAAAAAVHGDDGDCERFFTTGHESCEDWYAFLVGIGTNVVATECTEESSCEWTVGSDLHRALGIESVSWDFTVVKLDGWGSVQPDGNLLKGTPGLSSLDTDFWDFITDRIEDDPAAAEERVSARVPATLNADFASFVLQAATEWEEAP